jgi:hypothetical protein
MKLLALSPAEQRRLEKLARDAGRSPRSMMRFVLRDGFDFCEWIVAESLKSEESVRKYGTIPNEEVQRKAHKIIAAAHARRHKQAA